MTTLDVLSLAKETIVLTLLLSGPLLLVGMVVGVLISLFMAVTQIQEMTLTFVPKIVAVLATLLFFTPWMMGKMTSYVESLFLRIPDMIR
ncbi:MAG: flagellar biosynthesis protein FliQ [Thermodesulfobacteriota bacterium]